MDNTQRLQRIITTISQHPTLGAENIRTARAVQLIDRALQDTLNAVEDIYFHYILKPAAAMAAGIVPVAPTPLGFSSNMAVPLVYR